MINRVFLITFGRYIVTNFRMNNPSTPSHEDLDLADDRIVRNKDLPMPDRISALKRIDDRLGIKACADFPELTAKDVTDYCDLFDPR